MSRRRRLAAELAEARQSIADQERAYQALLVETGTEIAEVVRRTDARLAAQREEHAAVQRKHLADLAEARATSIGDAIRELTAQRDEAIEAAAVAQARFEMAEDARKADFADMKALNERERAHAQVTIDALTGALVEASQLLEACRPALRPNGAGPTLRRRIDLLLADRREVAS